MDHPLCLLPTCAVEKVAGFICGVGEDIKVKYLTLNIKDLLESS